mmetsp:Transcript_10150/g.25537  ORF Transcript_10150/g.25537 Transcript_10150/m.25537 type:complete len:204 (+) Transcript_10150:1996-2607(+)
MRPSLSRESLSASILCSEYAEVSFASSSLRVRSNSLFFESYAASASTSLAFISSAVDVLACEASSARRLTAFSWSRSSWARMPISRSALAFQCEEEAFSDCSNLSVWSRVLTSSDTRSLCSSTSSRKRPTSSSKAARSSPDACAICMHSARHCSADCEFASGRETGAPAPPADCSAICAACAAAFMSIRVEPSACSERLDCAS